MMLLCRSAHTDV